MTWPFITAFAIRAFLIFLPSLSKRGARKTTSSVCHCPGALQAITVRFFPGRQVLCEQFKRVGRLSQRRRSAEDQQGRRTEKTDQRAGIWQEKHLFTRSRQEGQDTQPGIPYSICDACKKK